MTKPVIYEWFVWLLGDCTEAAQNAEYQATYDHQLDETCAIVYAPMAESAKNIAGHFGTVLDWQQIQEAQEA